MPEAMFASGLGGIEAALSRGDLIAVVDVLRFSSTVTTAVAHGFTIIPSARPEEAAELAARTGLPRSGRSGEALYSLSPLDYLDRERAGELILTSPNGAACTRRIAVDHTGFIACFLNAGAAARALRSLAAASGRDVTLVAADETVDGRYDDPCNRRFALEDYLGCGCILSQLDMELAPEAKVCERAYAASEHDYDELLRRCPSGRELIERGREADLAHCLRRNLYEILPEVVGNRLVAHRKEG